MKSTRAAAMFAVKDGCIEVFTVQRLHVAEKLKQGQVHFQRWRDSRAYNCNDLPPALQLHVRRANLWMAGQYCKRVRRLRTAPIWAFFSRDNAINARVTGEEQLLHLRVPFEVLLPSMHRDWSFDVVRGCAIGAHEAHCVFGLVSCVCTRRHRRTSWERIFELSPNATVQAIMDRIEPRWLVEVESFSNDFGT